MRKKLGVIFIAALLFVSNTYNTFGDEELTLKEDEKHRPEDIVAEEIEEKTEDEATETVKSEEPKELLEEALRTKVVKESRGTARAIVQSGTIGTVDWTLDDSRVLTFGGGVFPDNYNWYGFGTLLRISPETVNFTAPITAGNTLSNMFRGFFSLREVNGLENLKTDNVTNMSFMFYSCPRLMNLDLSSLDTSNVTDMKYMFAHSNILRNLDLRNFNTSNVTNMSSMFANCRNLNAVLGISDFDTSNVTNMEYMFNYCASLRSLDLSSFNTSNVTNMANMFYTCTLLTDLDVSSFDTSNVTDFSRMFSECRNLRDLDLSGFTTLNQSMTNMFERAIINEIILGRDFRFNNEDHKFAAPLNNAKYTGKWKFLETGELLTHDEFLSYDGTASGKYVWEIEKYTVNYNVDGGSAVNSEICEYYKKATAPENPTKTGYTFDGWYKEASCTNRWNFVTEPVVRNTTLYAKWRLNTYNVNYNSNGGFAIPGETVAYNTAITTPRATFKMGYTFDGWYKEVDLVNQWNFNTDLMPANNITLYAKWNPNIYNVSYDSNGGSTVAGESVGYERAITEPITPIRAGYTFDGWYKEVDLINQWNFATDIMPMWDITLYAKWSINSYNVTYDTKGGSLVADEIVEYNSALTEPENPTKAGYIFEGWHKDENYAGKWEFLIDLVQGHTTLHAKWKAQEYQITYDLDGGTNSSNNPSTYEFAVGVTNFEDPIKEGYKFLGWFESANGGVKITSITDIEMGDKTLFARWEKAEVTGKAGTVNKYNKKGTSTGDTMNLLGVGLILMISAGYVLMQKKNKI